MTEQGKGVAADQLLRGRVGVPPPEGLGLGRIGWQQREQDATILFGGAEGTGLLRECEAAVVGGAREGDAAVEEVGLGLVGALAREQKAQVAAGVEVAFALRGEPDLEGLEGRDRHAVA